MKKFLKGTAVSALLLATTAVMATEPKIDLKTGNDAKSLVLEMDDASGTSEIRLTDSNGKTVHYENLSKSTYSKKFNMEELANGTYYFTVEHFPKKVVYAIALTSREIKIDSKMESSQTPVLTVSDNRIYLNLLNNDLNTVRAKVFNGNNQQLQHLVFKNDFTVGKVFNFENALVDDYRVVVEDGKNVYRQTISVK
ncbi:hypothetical protein RQM65_07155 [Pricia sp. S334]|uniref:Por secretion system C-terminal sorting domain-containing protein n=1 Tax=Pricia mediterranea TaxID=3076079 RepID=A0ABU3L485_9FLAO|nr:hypothetical protein [Pricia sp. S334]MDT7828435.1 hypothetical protein [Pricia sp. S334]